MLTSRRTAGSLLPRIPPTHPHLPHPHRSQHTSASTDGLHSPANRGLDVPVAYGTRRNPKREQLSQLYAVINAKPGHPIPRATRSPFARNTLRTIRRPLVPRVKVTPSASVPADDVAQYGTAGWGSDQLKPTSDNFTEENTDYSRSIEGRLGAHQNDLKDLVSPTEQRPIAQLKHGLDRILFNPGNVQWLQDPRSRVYNFPSWLGSIPDVKSFDFKRVEGFIPSSRDKDLRDLAKLHNCKFAGSTSSLTGMLSQIYLTLSNYRPPDTRTISAEFSSLKSRAGWSDGAQVPVSTVLWYRDGVYSTDSKYADMTSDKNVLTWMGTMLEKFLTLSENDFKALLREAPQSEWKVDNRREAFRYAKAGNYIMRSQLDCQHPQLPGTGIFDLKTRATLPIRCDVLNYEYNAGYHIRHRYGLEESFEREYYDLIRNAFLKYSFQARIGNMDGIFVAYHNTAKIFGFQYIPLEEMDERIYGKAGVGDAFFKKCVALLDIISQEIVHHFPKQNIACVWAAERHGQLRVWAEPIEWLSNDVKPVVELTVSLTNYVDGKLVPHRTVADALPGQWSVHYKIETTSQENIAAVHERQKAAIERQRYYFALPAGVDIKEMASVWETINFGGSDAESKSAPFNPDIFIKPHAGTRRLRELARVGRRRAAQQEAQHAGAAPVVYGQDETAEKRVPSVPQGAAARQRMPPPHMESTVESKPKDNLVEKLVELIRSKAERSHKKSKR